MKLHYLLYSRTLSKDYRWILRPSFIASPDINLLNSIFDIYDNYKDSRYLTQSNLPQIYCLNLRSVGGIVMCRKSEYKDAYSRAIYSLEGIAVEHKDKKYFSAITQFVFDKYDQYLSAWRRIEFSKADRLSKQNLETDIQLDHLRENASVELLEIQNAPHATITHYPKILSFDHKGYLELLRLVSSSKTHLLNIAFGAPKEVTNLFHDFEVIASFDRTGRHQAKTTQKSSHADSNTGIDLAETAKAKQNKESLIPPSVSNQILDERTDNNVCKILLYEVDYGGLWSFLGSKKLFFGLTDQMDNVIEKSRQFSQPANLDLLFSKPPFEIEQAFREFIDLLKAKGWQVLPEQGEIWWNLKLNRY